MTKQKPARPERPDGCPLFAHAGGTWAKKIGGKHVHFGPWSDLKGALREYQKHIGVAVFQPVQSAPKGKNPTLELLHDSFLTAQHTKATTGGKITLRTFRDSKGAVGAFCELTGWDLRYSQLGAEHFGAFAKSIDRYGAHAYNRNLTQVKQMFNWGVKAGILPHLPNYGAGFDKISDRVKRRQAAEKTARSGGKTFAPAEVRKMLAAAPAHLKAMILLGLNCGFGNTDVAELPLAAVDLKKGVIAYDRPKTGEKRRATLWPETIGALKAWLAIRPQPKPEAAHCVFVTAFGVPFVREAGDVKDGVIQSVVVVDSVGFLFRKLLDKLDPADPATGERKSGYKRDGRGFYSLRHTFRTIAEETGVQHPILRIMGHPLPGMSAEYVHHIPDSQLRAVTNHVRNKLFPRAARAKRIIPVTGADE